jgi:hypothetical protein
LVFRTIAIAPGNQAERHDRDLKTLNAVVGRANEWVENGLASRMEQMQAGIDLFKRFRESNRPESEVNSQRIRRELCGMAAAMAYSPA